MNKILAFTLGSIVAVGSIGAVAVSLPGTEPQVSVQAELPAGLTLNNVQDMKVKWDNEAGKMVVSFTIPGSANYYDYSTYTQGTYEFDKVDKVQLLRRDYTTYGDAEVIAELENVPVGACVMEDLEPVRGQKYSYSVDYYLGDNHIYYPSSSSPIEVGLFPGMITDFAYTTNKGSYPVVVSAKAPEFYKDGETKINEPLSVKVFSEESTYNSETYTYETITTVYGTVENVEAGSTFTVEIKEGLKENALNTLLLVATAADGSSDKAYGSIYLGEDWPGTPTNLVVTEDNDGVITLTWDAPEAARKGYFIPENTRYKVTVDVNDSNDEKELAKDLTETTFTYTPDLTKPTRLKFAVSSYNQIGSNNFKAESTVIAGPAALLPFKEGFDVESAGGYSSTWKPENLWAASTTGSGYPKQWQYGEFSYCNGSRIGTVDGTGAMAMMYYYPYDKVPQTDYMTSAKINVDGEGELELSFAYYEYPGFTNTVAGEISFDGGEFTELVKGDFATAEAPGWVTLSKTVEVPAGALTAVIRIAASNGPAEPANPCYLNIDNIKLRSTEAPAAVYPASVSDLAAEYDDETNTITVTMVAPAKSHPSLGDVNGADLDYITRIDLFRQEGSYGDYKLVHQFENPAPGEELSWTDEELGEGGYYYYKAIVYVEDFCDYGQFLNQPVLVGQIPGNVSDFKGASTKGGAPVVLTWTSPAKDSNGKDLKKITSMKVERQGADYTWTTLKVYDDAEPGTEYEYLDQDVDKDQDYSYKVTCYGTAGGNYGAQISVSTKEDTPDRPQNLKAVSNADGSVTVTWDPVTSGMANGYLDLDKLVYTVYRGGSDVYSETSAEVVAEGVKDATYTDKDVDFEEASVKYFVTATCGEKTGYSATSNSVMAGNPYSLPFVETFSTPGAYAGSVKYDNSWITEINSDAAYSSYWGVTSSYYVDGEEVKPASEDGGMAYCNYSTWTQAEWDEYLTSVHLKLADVKTPTITFHYYAVQGFNCGLALAVSFDNGEFNELWSRSYSDVTETGWEKVAVPVDVPEGAKVMQIRMISHKGSYSCPVIVDDIKVFDLPVPELTADDVTKELRWTVEPTEHTDLAGFHVYCDGNRKNEQMLEATVNTHPSDPDIAGNYTVTALYHGGQLESAHSEYVYVKGINGVGSVAADGVTVLAKAGAIVVEGAEGQYVTIHSTDGATVYAGTGDCKVALTPATYIVKVGAMPAVKIFVR